jgi:anti-anti-sigma factor
MGKPMQYTILPDDQGFRAVLTGRFTFQDHAVFRGLVGAIQTARGQRVAIDLEGVEFIDSAGLGMLLVANDACKKAGLDFVTQKPQGQVRRTMEIAAMGSIFTIQP